MPQFGSRFYPLAVTSNKTQVPLVLPFSSLLFVGPLGDVYANACDTALLAQQGKNLHGHLRTLGVAIKDLPQILLISDFTPVETARLVAAFELYAGLLFSVNGTTSHWQSVLPIPSK